MKTAKELKERFVEHLYDMKLDSMSVQELYTYGSIVKGVDEMEKPSYAEMMAEICKSGYAMGIGGASDKSKEGK